MSDNTTSTMSFDRMRSMLMRAAEIRDSEQQQIFDALDEIHARLSPLESLGSVRKRLSELPDRTEVGVLAERMDETLGKLEAQDAAIGGLTRAVDAVVDRLAKPFAELGGRLDGMAGRFEGVAGRMDGLEDRIAGLHKRIDDLDHHLDKQDVRTESLPTASVLRERLEVLEGGLRARLDEVDEGMHEYVGTGTETLRRSVSEAAETVGSAVADARAQLDPTERLDQLTARLDQVGGRLEQVGGRLDAIEESVAGRISTLNGALEQGLDKLDGSLGGRPDTEALATLIRRANEESEFRHAGQLDEAMATFAELILGGSGAQLGGAQTPPPRPAARRTRKTPAKARDTEETEGDATT